jgi:hypothetical protein
MIIAMLCVDYFSTCWPTTSSHAITALEFRVLVSLLYLHLMNLDSQCGFAISYTASDLGKTHGLRELFVEVSQRLQGPVIYTRYGTWV